ncbi:MAG TPA: signal peptidase I [Bryobacteraceae bacterium]|jgi:signal peptidase I
MSTKKEQVQPRGFIAEWAVTFILLLFGTTALAQAFVIPSGSMEETLLVGDHLLVDKLAYAPTDSATSHLLPYSDVHRGDIIVFRYPLDIRQDFVKRVIGVPGDHIHLEDRKLYLNGHLVDEPYTAYTRPPSHYADNFPRAPIEFGVYPRGEQMLRDNVQNGELVVPPGFYLAMGDNRDNSSDSRFWGLVPRENIIGKPLIIYWSYDATTEDLTNPGIGVSHLIDMVIHFPTKTRWSRTFRLVRPHPIS